MLITWLRSEDTLDFWWVETGAPAAPPPRANGGFGTKLIDAMVRSLGGTITRGIEEGGLKCAIMVPLSEFELPMRTEVPASVVRGALMEARHGGR